MKTKNIVNIIKTKHIYLVIGIIMLVLLISSGTYSYWAWATNTSQRTAVNFTAEKGFTCSGTGGEPLTSESISLLPTSCTDSEHVLKRVINITAEPNDLPLHMSLTLDVAEIGAGLSNSKKFRFALTTGSTSCTDGLVRAGHFNGKVAGDKVTILDNIEVETTTNFTYYLWVWLDKSETSPTTANQKFTLNLSGTCTNVPQSEAYAVYSATDKSLRFYRSETPITVGSTYNGRVATAVYTGFEDETYSSSSVPWRSYASTITTVVFEDEISPVSTESWFLTFNNTSSIDVSKLDTSNVTNMQYMFYDTGNKATVFTIDGFSEWNTSSVTNMLGMFFETGYSATTFNIDGLSGWDTFNVTTMGAMFASAGENATTFDIGGLSDWDTSSVTDMDYMFAWAGYSATTFDIGDLSKWDTSSVTNMSGMFAWAGYSATTFDIGDLSKWDTSSVTNMSGMFNWAGYRATTFDIGDLSRWDTSKVTNMSAMFSYAGYGATTFELDLSNWDTSKVTNMKEMFNWAGYRATTFDIGDLSRWDTSKVTNMSYMFGCAGGLSDNWSIGDLSGWDVSKVTNMSSMFVYIYYADTFFIGDISKWDTSSVTDMSNMFNTAGKNATYTLNLSGWNVSKVTSYANFNSSVESKVIPPVWVN